VERRGSYRIEAVGLGGGEPWNLDGGRVLRYERREDELSGAMVVSSVGSMNFMLILT
jgi:hypothetical protein